MFWTSFRRKVVSVLVCLSMFMAMSLSGKPFKVLPEAYATTYVGGTISQDTTWTAAGSPYVVQSDVTVNSGVTLTIEAGVVVKFSSLKRLTVNGTLNANATPSSKIYFTSLKDDSVGGDTNGDGSATSPAKGDWLYIKLDAASVNSTLNYTVIRYGNGDDTNYAAPLLAYTNSHTITNNEFSQNKGYAIGAGTNTTLNIGGNSASNNDRNGIAVRADTSQPTTISSSVTWRGNDLPYVVSNMLTVATGATLTIEPGAIVKLKDGISRLTLDGTLNANATPSSKIYFTSLKDDSVGGDTNGDGSATSPAKGDWAYIKLNSSSVNSVLNYATIRYGAYDNTNNWAPLLVYTNSASITNNTFSDNNAYAIAAGTNITLNVSGNTASNNFRNGIAVRADSLQPSTIASPVTWRGNDLPYVVNTSLTVATGVTLTIEPATVVKFRDVLYNITVNGTLNANATPSSRIFFTSFKDDSVGGDTNGDGSATSPAKGDWADIRFSSSSVASILDNAFLSYGGWNSSQTIYVNGSSPTITSNTIRRVAGKGIYLYNNATPTVKYNDIYETDSYGLYNSSAGTVTAEYNWWGIATNPSSKISGPADYDPWSLAPYTGAGGGADPQGRFGSDAPSGYFGEPVNTATGNYTYEHKDLNIPGKGNFLQIVRSYNSQDTLYNGPLGYGWTFNYNTSLRFNADDSVTWVKPNGQRYTFTKNSDGSYNTPQGIFEVLTKNADLTYTLKFKDQSKYNYNASGYLTSQVDKHGNTTTLSYASNQLATVTDSGTRTITLTYTNNRIMKIQDQTGRNVQYGYDGSGNLTTFTDMNSKATTFTYDSNHQLLTIGEPEPSTNPFLTSHYDANGKVDWQKDAFLATITFAYDTLNRRTTLTDNRGKQTVHEFDDRYRLTKTTDPLLQSVISAYGTLDVPGSVTNQNNKVTTFTYDANGNTTSTEDPLHHAVTASYVANNNLLWTKDALGRQTTYNYDPTGKLLTSIASPIGTTSFTYYTDGLLDILTDANNHLTDFGYNSYGNLTSIHDALTKATTFEYDTVGRMTASIDANNHKTQFTYDNEGNILTIKDPLAISDPGNHHQVDFTYDGNNNQKTFKDANNNLTQFDYDDMDNLTTVIDARGLTTSYTYDPNYNLKTVTDPLLHTTSYDYYDDNKLWKISDPLLNVLQFNYDPVGNLTKTTYPNGNETNYTYYDDNLLNTESYNNEPTSYSYTYNPTHTVNTVTDNSGKVFSYGYDNGNRLTSANDQTNPAITGGFTVQRSYDGVSNLTSLIYAGTTYTYGYNARDDLTSLLLPSGTVGFVYDDARNRTDVNTPDSSNRHYTYNDANRITQVRDTTNSGTQTFDYTHDANGNILSENSQTYSYDALNRLTSWVHSGVTTSYTYDDAGNLTQVADNGTPVKTFTYNTANQITNTGFTYDPNGNMASDGTLTYIYDGENRLKEVKQGANTIATYTYDYMGRRTSVTEGGTTTYFHHDGSNVVAETNSAGSTIATYTYDNTNQLVSMTRGGNTYYYQYNAHGDVVSLTNSLGQVINTYAYDPWGKLLSSTEQVVNPYKYAGYRYDASTGLYYLQKRYYSPTIVRFLTRDRFPASLKNPQSLNLYAYVNDNPTNLTDPTGEIAWMVPVLGAAAGAIGYTGGVIAGNWANGLRGQAVLNGLNGRDLAIASVGGAVGSVAIASAGAGVGGAALVGSVVSGLQYAANYYLNPATRTPSAGGFWRGLPENLVAGAIGGAIGGGANIHWGYGFLRNLLAGSANPFITKAVNWAAPYLKKTVEFTNPLRDPLVWGERN